MDAEHGFLQLIGPPGVGKTAILEGLASRIVAKEVPDVRTHVLAGFDSILTFGHDSRCKANVFWHWTCLHCWLVPE